MVAPLAITSGEPAGIGPELCLALAQRPWRYPLCVLGDRELLIARARQGGIPEEALASLNIVHVPLKVPSVPGRIDARNGSYVLDMLDRAIDGCRSARFSALITAPVHKGIINDAGYPFSGHTEYLAQKTGTAQVVMMLCETGPSARLRVALVTTHLPLRDVPAAITPQRLTSILRILHADLIGMFGVSAPRILVAGLNPHAGESGHMGREEIEVIAPVLERLRGEGMNLIGPCPADTLFTPSVLAQGDAQLAMYHDQGLCVLKHAAFDRAVNVTLGLPIIRTSVDHGTALDLAGRFCASPNSLFAAVELAMDLAQVRSRPL
jgi:4-hydroxythreonine-4-phosphate dehydrogenase